MSETEHCKDCCCAQCWRALGITEYTGLSIPEHIAALRTELETERIRLSACGVCAMTDTMESIAQSRISADNLYYSASYSDVARRVDECIRLRAENERLRAVLKELVRLKDLRDASQDQTYWATRPVSRETIDQLRAWENEYKIDAPKAWAAARLALDELPALPEGK